VLNRRLRKAENSSFSLMQASCINLFMDEEANSKK